MGIKFLLDKPIRVRLTDFFSNKMQKKALTKIVKASYGGINVSFILPFLNVNHNSKF